MIDFTKPVLINYFDTDDNIIHVMELSQPSFDFIKNNLKISSNSEKLLENHFSNHENRVNFSKALESLIKLTTSGVKDVYVQWNNKYSSNPLTVKKVYINYTLDYFNKVIYCNSGNLNTVIKTVFKEL